MPNNKTIVLFRVWKDKTKDVFALFPEEPHDVMGYYCTSYQHVGQHGGAQYAACIERSRPATRAEYQDLLKELRSLGYKNLKIVQRAPRTSEDTRRQKLNEIRTPQGKKWLTISPRPQKHC